MQENILSYACLSRQDLDHLTYLLQTDKSLHSVIYGPKTALGRLKALQKIFFGVGHTQAGLESLVHTSVGGVRRTI